MADKSLPVETLYGTIDYLYLISFCPPEHIKKFSYDAAPLREGLAREAGMSSQAFFSLALPEACRRIVAFHQNRREPDPSEVNRLLDVAALAPTSNANAAIFQANMARIAEFSARADPDRRLRKDKGCRHCTVACRYGFFSLTAKPNYEQLRELMHAESERPGGEGDPVRAAWSFTVGLIEQLLGVGRAYVSANHLGNLAYCLLTLGASASRYPLPKVQYQLFQKVNQVLANYWQETVEVKLAKA